ncbi:MAG: hypothetical protein R3F55_19010 [Alphaproteobacteria bacterium]
MYGGAEFQAVAAAESALIDDLAVRRGAEARHAGLRTIFGTATRLEAAFWQMGFDIGAMAPDREP